LKLLGYYRYPKIPSEQCPDLLILLSGWWLNGLRYRKFYGQLFNDFA